MISVEELYSHPDVEPYTLCGLADPSDVERFLTRGGVENETYEQGMVTYVQKVGFKEVHVAFTPEAWGREAANIIASSFARQMSSGVVLVAGEQEGYWRSRPPRSHGWKIYGDFQITHHPRKIRQWILTPDAWYNSPVGRKYA